MSSTLLRKQTLSTLCNTCRNRRTLIFKAPSPAFFRTSVATAQTDEPATKPRKKRATRTRRTLEPVPETWSRNLLEETKVETFLASLSDQTALSLDDIERHKPAKHAPASSPQYEEDYSNLLTTLCASFSKKQLRQLGEMYGLERSLLGTNKLKADYAAAIVEKQWGWPSLVEVKKHNELWKTYSEISIPVTPTEMFFIIGKDGSELLSLASRHRVHVSLLTDPLRLTVEGIKGELERVTAHIGALKQGIMEETITLPTSEPLQADLVQRISRLANAYIQNMGGKGMIRICAKDAATIATAQRLAVRAACELNQPPTSVLGYLPPPAPPSAPVPISLFPQMYSMYPFTSPRPLPWTVAANNAFRVRKVGEWLSESSREEGGLAHGSGQYLTLLDDETDMKTMLLSKLPKQGDESMRSVTASLGHIVWAPSDTPRSSLIPPLQGSWVLPKILQFLSNNTNTIKPVFTPSLPASMLDSTPSQRTVLHHLEYQALSDIDQSGGKPELNKSEPVKTIEWRVELTGATPTPAPVDEAPISDEDVPALAETSASEPSEAPGTQELPVTCQAGFKTRMYLLLPDRPMDIEFTAFDSKTLSSEDIPAALRQYKESLESFLAYVDPNATQPNPPLKLVHKGETYILNSTTSIRQSTEKAPAALADDKTEVVSESVLDLESSQKSVVCKLVCNNAQDDIEWGGFLGDCDGLTRRNERPIHF